MSWRTAALAEVSQLPHLSSDATRKRLVGVAAQQRVARAACSAEFNLLTYAELGRRGVREIAACGGAIVDATFRHRADRDAFANVFGDAAPVLFVECCAPAGVLAERAAMRDRQPRRVSDASLSVVVHESLAWEPLDELPPETHATLRSDRPVESQLEDLRALLDRRIDQLTTRRSEPLTASAGYQDDHSLGIPARTRWRSNHSPASRETSVSAPGSSNRWVAPGTIASSDGARSMLWASRFSSTTISSSPPTISSTGARTSASRAAARSGRPPRETTAEISSPNSAAAPSAAAAPVLAPK